MTRAPALEAVYDELIAYERNRAQSEPKVKSSDFNLNDCLV